MRLPILVGDLELSNPITDLDMTSRADRVPYQGARLLVRMQGLPIGYASISADAADADSIAAQVWQQFASVINIRRGQHGLPPLASLPHDGIGIEEELAEDVTKRPAITVVLCTRDRHESVAVTLRGLAMQRYQPFEVLVVDNAPSSDSTRDLFNTEFGADPRFHYLREPRPGLSHARNCGVARATSEVIAFTDDDVRVDQGWLEGIARGFQQADNVACVTGLVRAAALDSPAQLYFDQRQGWGTNCERRVFDLAEHRDASPLYPYSNVFGAGANFAMTRTVLNELGGFDEALGAGTPCGGGEDLEIFTRTVLAGHRVVYEPSAVVSHVHRADVNDLSAQMLSYGSGATAALTAIALRSSRARLELPTKIVIGAVRISAIGNRTKDQPALPSGLVGQELRGMLRGPWLYLKARRQLRRHTPSEFPGPTSEHDRPGEDRTCT